MTHIDLLDTTLRDGIQGAGISLSLSDRRKIIDSLDALGVHFIEVGNPATSPKDAELCRELAGAPLTNAKLTAFGSTRRKGVSAAEDGNLNGLLRAETEYVTIFGKASPTHVRHVLRCTAAENLDMIAQSVRWLAEHDRRVIYDAEHFFDGYAEDAAYALATLRGRSGRRGALPVRHQRRRLSD